VRCRNVTGRQKLYSATLGTWQRNSCAYLTSVKASLINTLGMYDIVICVDVHHILAVMFRIMIMPMCNTACTIVITHSGLRIVRRYRMFVSSDYISSKSLDLVYVSSVEGNVWHV